MDQKLNIHKKRMVIRQNDRNCTGTHFDGQHLSLLHLKEKPVKNEYLFKDNIPPYPECVEFHVEKVSHVTGEQGLKSIFRDSGFKRVDADQPYLLWWGLSVSPQEICSAEERFLASLFPNESPAQIRHQSPVLEYFTSSNAFQEKSSYGNFCFTFSIRELLWHYGDQFCGDHGFVLSVYETVLFKQEIQYTVLVHPKNVKLYGHLPRLPIDGNSVCGYKNGAMWWHCQSPSETYEHMLEVNWSDSSVGVSPHYNKEYYVWDHVCVAFHMEPGWVLHVDRNKLLNRVSACEMSKPYLLRLPDIPLSYNQAEQKLADLKASMGWGSVAGGWS